MNFIQRKDKPRPFAANSTGRLRGTLNLGARTGRVQVYEAIGEARDLFIDKISKAIVSHLNDHNDKLQDSAHFVDLSLFMMGKSPDRTKPVVMFVSDDRQTRTDAFRMIKNSGIMNDHPGFGLGEMELKAEFEHLQFLLSGGQTEPTPVSPRTAVDPPASNFFIAPEEPIEVFGTSTGLWNGQRLEVRIQNGSTINARRAVGGVVVSFREVYMLHSVDYFLPTKQTEQEITMGIIFPSDTSEVDAEVLGLSDDDEEDDNELAEITSHGSVSPVTSDSGMLFGSSFGSDDQEALLLSYGSLDGQDAHSSDFVSRLEILTGSEDQSLQTTTDEKCPERVGHVVLRLTVLDSAFVRIDAAVDMSRIWQCLNPVPVIPLESYQEHIETIPSDTAVKAFPPSGTVDGILLGTPSFVRLPGSRVFQEVYVAKLDKPLSQGDSGSWIKNAITGKLLGHVIAGSPTTGLVLLVPAAKVFAAAVAAFSAEEEKLRSLVRKVGCTTCKSRRIKCDGALPRCNNCGKSKRECIHYPDSVNTQRSYTTKGKTTGKLATRLQQPPTSFWAETETQTDRVAVRTIDMPKTNQPVERFRTLPR